MILIPSTTREADALQVAAQRGRVRRLAHRVYTDDLATDPERIVQDELLVILGARFPELYVSHSTAALLRPHNGQVFLSGSATRRPLALPGVTIHRLSGLPFPETRMIELDETVMSSLSADPLPARVSVSSPLQTVFEVLSADARQPHRSLPEENIRALIKRLSETDRTRAGRFATRNKLKTEYDKFQALADDLKAAARVLAGRAPSLDLYFYAWRVGRLEELSGREFRFTYDSEWPSPLTTHLPVPSTGPAYEGPGLPSFLDNLLPEGWAEARLQAVHHIATDDPFGLLRTTPRYLSNLTLRSGDFDPSGLEFDQLGMSLRDLVPDPAVTLPVVEQLGGAPDTRELWLELRRRGATRLSGVQAKLPVHLEVVDGSATLSLAGVARSGSHILKFQGQHEPDLVQNEWATMELARQAGLSVAEVRQVSFQTDSTFSTPGLLIERFDIPDTAEPGRIDLIEDGASLLGMKREDKYRTSVERLQDALADAGLSDADLLRFFDQVVFSWLVGNGDLHAKNISVLREFRTGTLGAPPEATGVRLSPAYDLINTAIVIRGDLFALPVNGRQNNLRRSDFLVLAERGGCPRREAQARIEALVDSVLTNLDMVLDAAGLSDERTADYRAIVGDRCTGLA